MKFNDYRSRIDFERYLGFMERCKEKREQSELTGYKEKHHIIPKSLGGIDEKDNLIFLSAREHFIAHLILWKAFGGPMAYAFIRMSTSNQNGSLDWLTGKQYEKLRAEVAERTSLLMSGENHPFFGKKRPEITGENHPNFGKRGRDSMSWHERTEEECEAIRKGVKKWWNNLTPEEKDFHVSQKRVGKLHSEETKDKMSQLKLDRIHISDPKTNEKKFVYLEDYENTYKPLGWVVGRGSYNKEPARKAVGDARRGVKDTEETRKKKSNSKKGSKWVNNGEIQRFVKGEELKNLLDRGYIFGQLYNTNAGRKKKKK